MSRLALSVRLDKSATPLRRALQYAFYDWTREMPRRKRIITYIGFAFQGYAIYVLLMWLLQLPTWLFPYYLVLPKRLWIYPLLLVIYFLGYSIQNSMLTSEFVRKTQLEADIVAARQIQRNLIPQTFGKLPGYEVEAFHKPLREVGGDYFDVIELPGNRTLFVIVDVAGKGMPAALLAANIQALVRNIANTELSPQAFAAQINQHLSRYTPDDRFATAVFLVLDGPTGELTYVNAGHNPPIVQSGGSNKFLPATGMPLGLFAGASYDAGTAVITPAGILLLFTDGLTDSIPGANPEQRLMEALSANSGGAMSTLKALVDPRFNEDDITILLLKRNTGTTAAQQTTVLDQAS